MILEIPKNMIGLYVAIILIIFFICIIIYCNKKNNCSTTTDKENLTPTSISISNPVGKILNVIGWIYIILSVLFAFVLLRKAVVLTILVACIGSLFGLLLIGFGEVINLLQDIKNK